MSAFGQGNSFFAGGGAPGATSSGAPSPFGAYAGALLFSAREYVLIVVVS